MATMLIAATELLVDGGQYLWSLFKQFPYLFYMANPYETMFSDLKHVPRYTSELFPVLVLLALIENALRLLTGRRMPRLNDSIASFASGLVQDCFRIHIRSLEVIIYCLIFDRFRLATLPWDSLQTWFLCFFMVDIGFYFAHRLAHEIHFIWTIHQAHHSGEDFNISAALRQAVLQPFTAWLTYIPMAILGVPPPIFLVHLQLIEMYMIWIHTEVVQSLGILETFLHCPSHHRVHHGRNRKYIDKNYAGLFIIWDRLFGTFEPEDPDDPPIYGLVKPVESFNIFYLQFHSLIAMIRSIREAKGWKNKLAIPFKGPGWSPGKPRLGYIDEIPEIEKPVIYWDPQIATWKNCYVLWHFAIILLFYHELSCKSNQLTQLMIFAGVLFILATLTAIGFLLEDKPYALMVESARCLVALLAEKILLPLTDLHKMDATIQISIMSVVRLTYISSIFICVSTELYRVLTNLFNQFKFEIKYHHID